jgi:hypothetical protein
VHCFFAIVFTVLLLLPKHRHRLAVVPPREALNVSVERGIADTVMLSFFIVIVSIIIFFFLVRLFLFFSFLSISYPVLVLLFLPSRPVVIAVLFVVVSVLSSPRGRR